MNRPKIKINYLFNFLVQLHGFDVENGRMDVSFDDWVDFHNLGKYLSIETKLEGAKTILQATKLDTINGESISTRTLKQIDEFLTGNG